MRRANSQLLIWLRLDGSPHDSGRSHGTRQRQADRFALQIIEPHPIFFQVSAECTAVFHLETGSESGKRLREIVSKDAAQF